MEVNTYSKRGQSDMSKTGPIILHAKNKSLDENRGLKTVFHDLRTPVEAP